MLTQKLLPRHSVNHPAVRSQLRAEVPEGSLAARLIDADPLALTGGPVETPVPRVPARERDDLVALHERAQRRPIGVSSLEYWMRRHLDPSAREFHDTGEVEAVRIPDQTVEMVPPEVPERVGHMVLEKTIVPLDREFTPTQHIPRPPTDSPS